jgi:hypothetical protein
MGAVILASGKRLGTSCTGRYVGLGSGLGCYTEISPPPGFEIRVVQPVASRYTEYAIPATCNLIYCVICTNTFRYSYRRNFIVRA